MTFLELKKNLQNQQEIEELEQYGTRLCFIFERISTEKYETSDNVLEKIMKISKESGVEIPDIFDRARRIGEPYIDKTTKNHVRAPLFGLILFASEQ